MEGKAGVRWGVMELGNIAPGAEFEPTPLAFLVSALTITPPRLPEYEGLPYTKQHLPIYKHIDLIWYNVCIYKRR